MHIAIIPDGNRRWAKKKRFKPWLGHQKGIEIFEKILEKSREMGITYITFWAGSRDNLTKRPKREIDFLFKTYKEQFERMVKDERTHKDRVKIRALGEWNDILPEAVQQSIRKAIEATKNYNKHFLTFLLAYNGTDEMTSCIQKIIGLCRDKKMKITPKLIKENLWTKDLPQVDLVIRTGCQDDPHISSGFMMWDTAYAQLCFTKTLFPDFSPKEFEKIVKDFSKRERRLGA